ncbi:S41 family peptidase [Desulfobacterium sp. N47]|uniref:Carboxy-terminal-processing protease n=1 Tax=uncultured Desulfobacterium sp. TaxID=201089 RepID=E1YEY9_9BACT|nr:Carboxy-terminal-processing protease [uncultured Desulfobacterium sp.]
MDRKKYCHIRLWITVIIAAGFLTIGTGFSRDLSASNEETYRGLKIFSDVLQIIENDYVDPVDTKELVQKAIQGMIRGLDPHSALLPPEALEDLEIDSEGEFPGIGIHITLQNDLVTVISPIEGTPAFKAGIKAKDKIIKIGGVTPKDLRDAVSKMRGPKGTSVVVTILREGVPDPIDFTLVRDIIPVESIKSMSIRPGYGYIWITNFTGNTTEDFLKALEKLESSTVPLKGLILDLRDNGGGLLNQAIKISDIFLEEGKILSIEGRHKKNSRVFKAHPDKVKRTYPIIVLINGGTASASEIVAGALQDQKRALLIGTTSFGKGSVQSVEPLRDGYALKLTIARYYTPSGRSIQAKGIEPDIVLRHKMIGDETNYDDGGMLKEKDLKNHIDANPDEKKDKKETAPDIKKEKDPATNKDKKELGKKTKMREFDYRLGPLTIEGLQSDNQVMHALEILLSYEIFKDKLKN